MATTISSSKKGTEVLCTHHTAQGPSAFFFVLDSNHHTAHCSSHHYLKGNDQ